MSSNTQTLQNVTSVDDFLNIAATETIPLFEHLSFEFLLEYDVFAPCKRGRTRVHEPPELFQVFLHCYYEDVYGTRPVARELQKPLVWLSCGLDRPPSRDVVDRFLIDLEHVVDDAFDHLVEQAAVRGLLGSTYRIDSTHVKAIPWNDDASWNYDSIAEKHYYGFGCTIVSTGAKIPIAAEFTPAKQAPEITTQSCYCETKVLECEDLSIWCYISLAVSYAGTYWSCAACGVGAWVACAKCAATVIGSGAGTIGCIENHECWEETLCRSYDEVERKPCRVCSNIHHPTC